MSFWEEWGSLLKGIGIIVIFIMFIMGIYPKYNVWASELKGKAEFVQAEENRKIKVEEAIAMKEASQYYADAEVIRAKGVDEANKIIAGGLKGNEAYLRYLWIQAMGEKDEVATIYIPVGNDGLPIMKTVESTNTVEKEAK